MYLKVAGPWKDSKHGVYHLRQRTPADLAERLQGHTVKIPIGGAWACVKIGPIVQASLRTKEPRIARFRHAIADSALKGFWNTQRNCGQSDTLSEACAAEVRFPKPIVVETDSPPVIAAYERKIAALENRKPVMAEKIETGARPRHAFELFERAVMFLANPWNI